MALFWDTVQGEWLIRWVNRLAWGLVSFFILINDASSHSNFNDTLYQLLFKSTEIKSAHLQ